KLILVPSSYWQVWESKTDNEWDEIVRLHQDLGGNGDLNELRKFIENQFYKHAFCIDLKGELWINLLPQAFSDALVNSTRGECQRVIREIGSKGWSEEIQYTDFSEWAHPLAIVVGVMGNPPEESQLMK